LLVEIFQNKGNVGSQTWWHMPVSPVLRQDCEFEDSLDYIERPCLKKEKKKRKTSLEKLLFIFIYWQNWV
jgi:hypothetical protein